MQENTTRSAKALMMALKKWGLFCISKIEKNRYSLRKVVSKLKEPVMKWSLKLVNFC